MKFSRWMTALLVSATVCAASVPAFGQNTRDGWSIQFREETFDGVIFPLAGLSEDSDSFMSSRIFIACDEGDDLAVFFQLGSISFSQAISIEFRDLDGTQTINFASGEVPNLGRRLRASSVDSSRLIGILESVGERGVAFRSENSAGTFTPVATTQALEVMHTHCP